MTCKKRKASTTRRWHRSIGAGAAVFIVFLVTSGLVLNHSHQLGLDRQHLSQPMLLRWYGPGEPAEIRHYAVDGQWLSFAGSQLYLDGEPVTIASDGLGVIAIDDWLLAACREELLLLTRTGELIERIPWEPPGARPITAIGRATDGAVVVKSAGHTWLGDTDLLDWTQVDETSPKTRWSSPGDAPAKLSQMIAEHYHGGGISLEKLLLDIHSGRIFGTVGILVYDLLALALGLLALSGLVLWRRGRRNGRRNGNGNGSPSK